MKNVYIVSAVRTPVGKRNGYLREWNVPQLLGKVLDAAVERINLDPALVEDVINGTVYQVGEQGLTLGRTGVWCSKFPVTVPGTSVNRQCGSSLTTIQLAHGMIASGNMDVVIASGCEMMSKYPIEADQNGTLFNGNPMGNPYGTWYKDLVKGQLYNQGTAAQAIAEKYGVTKDECNQLAVSSHQKAHKATVEGYFKREILPMQGLDKDGNKITVDKDETIRPETNMEGLNGLKAVLGSQWLTAGMSSPVTDGASAVVLMSEEKMKELKLTPLARIVMNTVIGSDPILMLTGPVDAIPKVLKKANLKMDDIDIFEINEAFAPIPMACVKAIKVPLEKMNVNGGALALGHPVGNSGCRLTVTAIYELMRRKSKYGLITLCTGGAMAPATIIERV